MEARAIVRNVRMTPRKIKLICDLIRGKDAGEAMAIIMNTPKAACEPMEKLLKSAVANAENRLIINTITLSTNETPDTASSPTFAVMIESASPTVTVNICSMINGMINRTRSLFENILFLALSVISILFPFFFCVLKIISVFCLLFYSFYLITLLILFKV